MLFIFINPLYALDITLNESGLGGEQVDTNNLLFIDFSNIGDIIVISLFFIMLVISFIFIIHFVNSFLLTIFSIMLMANGFNLLISFIIMLISITLISVSKNK